MKIAYLARRPIPSVHAHSVQIVKMCEAFGNLGHEITLFIDQGEGAPESIYSQYGVGRVFGVDALPKRLQRLKKPRFVARLLRHPFIHRADVYYGRDITSLAALALSGKPVIYEAHTMPPINSFRWRLLSWLFARDNFCHLVCVTSSLAELHRQHFAALASKPIIVAPNAAAEVTEVEPTRAWPGRPEAIQIGFIGRPFPGKGIELMVEAALELPDLDFHVVGAIESDLHWIASTLPSNLHLHGYRPHGLLGSYLKRFDVAVAPYGAKVMNASRVESAAITSPLKLLEYMAAGLPIIVSDLPGVRDIVADKGEEVAVLVPPGDGQTFFAALAHLASNPRLRQKMGQAARARYLERHTVEARAKTVLGTLAGRQGQELPCRFLAAN